LTFLQTPSYMIASATGFTAFHSINEMKRKPNYLYFAHDITYRKILLLAWRHQLSVVYGFYIVLHKNPLDPF